MKKYLLSALFAFSALALAYTQDDPSTLTKVGDKAPQFICKTIDGRSLDLSKLQGKIVMINFFATWCGPCNLELPVLQKNIWDKYKGRQDFELVILGREHSEAEVRKFVEGKKFTMPFAPDPERKIFSLYATQSIPRNVIVGKDGRIIFQSIGFTPEEFRELENLLAEQMK
ncbi:MAG: TlpA family protein disulfide reductase [Bacteroidales bacterium]|jgi:peroxiredoxin|nr:TlpA family protein disulfide reductase [Bacteroidales bacterium]MCU0407624.1 TlpA family protein disulfide reductase [Bacteroidales bacterium]